MGLIESLPSVDEDRRGRTPSPGFWHEDPILARYTYVYRKVSKEYLKCDIDSWKQSRWKNAEEIAMDTLSTEFFDWDRPEGMGKRKTCFTLEGETYRRVVGYRELMVKREYAEYLRDLKCKGGGRFKGLKLYQYWKLARGGGPKKATTPPAAALAKKGAAGAKKPGGEAGTKPGAKKGTAGAANKGKSGGKLSNAPRPKQAKKKLAKQGGCFSCFQKHKPSKRELRDEAKKKTEKILHHQAVKLWKWPHHRKRLPVPPSPNADCDYVVLNHRLYRMPKEKEERDNEWLYLSTTTEDKDPEVVSHFEKEMHKWMTPGISFESQKLFRQLALLWTLMNISGRSFLHHRNNYFRGHIEFSSKKRHMLPFFLTSVLLWTVLCVIVCSYADINTKLTVMESKSRFYQIEYLEIHKYWLPFSFIIANLILVTFWSLAVVLGDGSLIAHYINCCCASLHEMETSGALEIRKITLNNLKIFILYAAIYTGLFLANWPALIRGSCTLTSMLLLRPSIPLLRITTPRKLLVYQWIGFGIQMYILFCARLVMCFLQVFALVLKNISEMWNFKFALRFKLLSKESRGELYQLELQHSLAKLWTHHRLIVLLFQQYGLVFSIGIMCYMIPQLFVFAFTTAHLLLYVVGGSQEQQFYGNQTHIEIYSDNKPTIRIPYYHSGLEFHTTALIIFLQIAVDFFFTTETLIGATEALMTGAEFLRRTGLMSCEKSHERRLILSLQWSFSPSRLRALTANRFLVLDRRSLAKLFSIVVLIFTVIVRIQKPSPPTIITFPKPGSCNTALGQELVNGICRITGPPKTPRPPPDPPATFYYFMDDCVTIEKKFTKQVKSFQYFSDNSTGVLRTADKGPFQICWVNLDDGAQLPPELEGIGRYFQDRGNAKLKQTLLVYLNQTVDVTKIDYTTIKAATVVKHPDSTAGTYCGPDSKGQPGSGCEWVEYYRDCVVVCYSAKLGRNLLIPRIWKKLSSGAFVMYSDYSRVDCGVNPFGFLWKGDLTSQVDPAYDCFGKMIDEKEFDLCSNIRWKEPVHKFTPALGNRKVLQRGYTSQWTSLSKTVISAGTSPIPCEKCYNYNSAEERCLDKSLVENHCLYSNYWGELAPVKGYYFAEQCFARGIDHRDKTKPNGFCNWFYVEGGILAGHVISDASYKAAKTMHWTKEWDLAAGDKPPCEQFGMKNLRPIEEHLYFKHLCLTGNPTPSVGCANTGGKFYFTAYRPYELVQCTKLRQIRIDYETDKGNADICDLAQGTMRLPENMPVFVGGMNFTAFYSCSGKRLLPSNKGKTYNCTSPAVNGFCEVDADQGMMLHQDCQDPEVLASKSVTIVYRMGSSHQHSTPYGFCQVLYDKGEAAFKDLKRKVMTEDFVYNLRDPPRTGVVNYWQPQDKWKIQHWALTAPVSCITTLPSSTGTTPFCDEYCAKHWCGVDSVALHFPYDGRDSVAANDAFLCNWHSWIRDCVQPFQSELAGWVYLPRQFLPSGTLHTKQRRREALLNVFIQDDSWNQCAGRRLPAEPGQAVVSTYWKDDCGYHMTPEFTDGDPKSIAIMPAVLPISMQYYSDDGQTLEDRVLHCYDSYNSLFRCTHPDIFPICKSNLSNWEPSHGEFDYCYRFSSNCYTAFNKQPSGSKVAPEYPQGFCRGYCPEIDLKREGVSEPLMDVWRNISNLRFPYPPCLVKNNRSYLSFANILYEDYNNPRDIEAHLFFEFHCSDPTKNGAIREGPVTGTFHWPLFQDKVTTEYRFVPLQPLMDHLTANFGPDCNYGAKLPDNEDKIYPQQVTFSDSSSGGMVTVDRSEFVGCNGYPLIHFTEEFRKDPKPMIDVGITDPVRDAHIACFNPLLAGWCEAIIDKLIFLRDDFEITCNGSQGSIQVQCPAECTAMQGHWSNHSLALNVTDVPGYYPFVQSTQRFVITVIETVSSNWSIRTDVPFRRVVARKFREITHSWAMYENPKTQVQWLNEYRRYQTNDATCFQATLADQQKSCTWEDYLRRCIIPCNLIYPETHITRVGQSLVETTPGQGNMFLKPLVQYYRGGKLEPIFTFADCVIDPGTNWRYFTTTTHTTFLYGCASIRVRANVDNFRWTTFPEYLPDTTNQIVDPATGFVWIPWKIDYAKKANFTYELLSSYHLLPISYAPVSTAPKISHTVNTFVSPYFACQRMTQEPMRLQIITSLRSYMQKALPYPTHIRIEADRYLYHPEATIPEDRACVETPIWVYLSLEACTSLKIPSKLLKIIGMCKAIFPAGSAHSSFAALMYRYNGTPPEGCITNSSDYTAFQKMYSDPNGWGKYGFAIKYAVPDVHDMWNSYCHSCAYTRDQHRRNAVSMWCGFQRGVDHSDHSCISEMESFTWKSGKGNPAVSLGEGIFYGHWNWALNQIGILWRYATKFYCFYSTNNTWIQHARWRVYHPWSQVHERKDQAAYLIHVALNALGCPYPCRGVEEHVDCNSKCPLDDHNPCTSTTTLQHFQDFWSYNPTAVGLNYTVFLKENGSRCQIPLPGLNNKLQAFGLFGEYGINIMTLRDRYFVSVETPRNGYNVELRGTSELITKMDGKWHRGGPRISNGMHVRLMTDFTTSDLHDETITIDDPWEVPRFSAFHPVLLQYGIDYTQTQISNYCAAFDGDNCEIIIIRFMNRYGLLYPPRGYNSWGWYFYTSRPREKPYDHLQIVYGSNCTNQDRTFVKELLDTDPRYSSYCCIPNQFDIDRYPNSTMAYSTDNVTEWEERYLYIVRGTFDYCRDVRVGNRSHFGYLHGFDKFGRFLTACTFSKCQANTCANKLRGYKGITDTDLCTRQFDPNEEFLKQPLPRCQLPLPPF